MNVKSYLKIIIVLLVLILSYLIFSNFDAITFKYTKVTQDNYYTILSSISSSKLSVTEQNYLKIALFNYSFDPSRAYGKSVNALISEGKVLTKDFKDSITNIFK